MNPDLALFRALNGMAGRSPLLDAAMVALALLGARPFMVQDVHLLLPPQAAPSFPGEHPALGAAAVLTPLYPAFGGLPGR